MNCARKHGKPSAGDAQVRKDPSKQGNGVSKYGDKDQMERHQMKYEPGPKSGKVDDRT